MTINVDKAKGASICIEHGSLVAWADEYRDGSIREVGIVLSTGRRDDRNGVGAWICWPTGIYWSPVESVVSVNSGGCGAY